MNSFLSDQKASIFYPKTLSVPTFKFCCEMYISVVHFKSHYTILRQIGPQIKSVEQAGAFPKKHNQNIFEP